MKSAEEGGRAGYAADELGYPVGYGVSERDPPPNQKADGNGRIYMAARAGPGLPGPARPGSRG